ncbi:hypothetical protein EON65_16440 [archaeon]|nr:MAG: hypothetical protein EON65_16440 [archaeon]
MLEECQTIARIIQNTQVRTEMTEIARVMATDDAIVERGNTETIIATEAEIETKERDIGTMTMTEIVNMIETGEIEKIDIVMIDIARRELDQTREIVLIDHTSVAMTYIVMSGVM